MATKGRFQKMLNQAFGLEENSSGAEESQLEFTVSELQSRFDELFGKRPPAWRGACLDSPDILLRAESPEAIEAGEYELVLGECHWGVQTIFGNATAPIAPKSQILQRLLARDVFPAQVYGIYDYEAGLGNASSRIEEGLLDAVHVLFKLAGGQDPAPVAERAFRAGELRVQEVDGILWVEDVEHQEKFRLLDLVGWKLKYGILLFFLSNPSLGNHTPRIRVNGITCYRETWEAPLEEFPLLENWEDLEQFLEIQAWLKEKGIPRDVFCKLSTEMKPFWVDFSSPISTFNLVTLVRGGLTKQPKGGKIRFSEMLPGRNELWMRDSKGEPLTSEFRIVLRRDQEVNLEPDQLWPTF